MATLSDVLTAIVELTSAAIYPNGTSAPTVADVDCQIYVGWPVPQQLTEDIGAGKAHVSVFPRPRTARNKTRFQDAWVEQTPAAPTLTATISENTITMGGTITPGDLVVPVVNGKAYPYAVQSSDTLATVATAVAALLVVDIAGTSASGAVITLPSTAYIDGVRLGGQGTALRPLNTVRRTIQVTVWAPDPVSRATLGAAALSALADLRRIPMPDGTKAPVQFADEEMLDNLEKVMLYRHELFWDVEYTAVASGSFTSVTTPNATIN